MNSAQPKKPVQTRETREAEALRENLRKRKLQAQARTQDSEKDKN